MPSKSPAAPRAANKARTFRGKPVDVVIDVRSKLEYWLGHLDGATCIPAGDIVMRVAARKDIDPDSRIMVYCASGGRSAAAASQLRAMGFRHVTDAGAISEALGEYQP
jgi:phage shock protein E